MARARPDRYRAVLGAAPTRGGAHQERSQQDHRPGYRLALTQRAEEGAEGMIDRRGFLRRATAGAVAALGLRASRALAEPPPETTKIRLAKTASMCWAPQYIADELLKAEGFAEVSYLEMPVGVPVSKVLASRDIDISMNFVGPNLLRIDQGDPAVFLA